MSLEARIELLTAAVIELTAAIGRFQEPVPMISAEFTLPENADLCPNGIIKIEDLPEAPKPHAEDLTAKSVEASASKEPALSSASAVTVQYSDVAKLVTQIAKTDLAKAKAALARLGVKHGKELTEAQWPEAVTYLTRVAAGEIDPETSHE